MSESAEGFLRGAALLALAGLLSRLLGFYRLLLPRLVGPGGVGLYHMAYPVYATALVLATAGFPVAVSKLVAERLAEGRGRGARRVFLVSLLFLGILGGFVSIGLAWLAGPLSVHLARDPRARLPLLAIAPAVFLVSVLSAFRGLYQGRQRMAPTAVSQVVEQAVRVVTILVLVLWLRRRGVAYAAAGAAFGAVTGAAAALVYLLVLGTREPLPRGGPPETEGVFELLGRILSLALPVALAGLVLPASQLLDLAIVPRALRLGGFSGTGATALYGELTGYAMPLLSLPGIVLAALGISLVPAVAEARAQGDSPLVAARVGAALRLGSLIGLPAAAGLLLLGRPLAALLFARAAAGRLVTVLSPAVAFLGWETVAAAALQGVGLAGVALGNFLLGAVLKAGLGLYLVPRVGVAGAAAGTVLELGVTALLNLAALYRRLGSLGSPTEIFLKPFLAALIMGLALALAAPGLGGSAPTVVIGLSLGLLVYLLSLISLGGLRAADLELVPGIGRRLARSLRRIGWLRG